MGSRKQSQTSESEIGLLEPSVRNMTIDMTQLSGRVQARWFDPTNATLSQIAGSPFLNIGTRVFTPPAANSAGDGDFVLVLEAK